MRLQLDEQDIRILQLLQRNCRLSSREIAENLNSPVTTVFTKIKRMEKLGLIKEYRAILDSKTLGKGATAFILVSVTYRNTETDKSLSQREVAKKISQFAEVQEVHIIAGDWDILIKIRAKDVETIGKFVIDKLRLIRGIEKTLTCMVFHTEKETTELSLMELKEKQS
jgi:DNA-binding Lrp family transcriptional regulator